MRNGNEPPHHIPPNESLCYNHETDPSTVKKNKARFTEAKLSGHKIYKLSDEPLTKPLNCTS